MTSCDAGRAFAAVHAHRDAIAGAGHLDARSIQPDVDTLVLQDLAHRVGDVFVLAADQTIGLLDHRYVAAEAAVHLREFEAYIASPHDDEVLGEEVHIHHAAVGQKRNFADALDIVRYECPSAGVDEDTFRLQKLLADTDAV